MARIRAGLPRKAQFLFRPMRYKILRGGRAGAKSWTCARVLSMAGVNPTIIGMNSQFLRILCAREIQKSIQQSVHQLLKDQIVLLGLDGFYDVKETKITGRNGTLFSFTGLNTLTADSIKSYEGYDIAWMEEAHMVSKRSWDILLPTIRKEGSEIWASYNPELESDEVHKRFTVNQPDNCINVEMNWRDNPYLTRTANRERLYCKEYDPDNYDHIWGGECRSNATNAIFSNWRIEDLTGRKEAFDPLDHGLDFGYSNDPTAYVKTYYHSATRTLYILEEYANKEVTNREIAEDLKPLTMGETVTCDSAEPKSIAELNAYGLPATGASKGRGSVMHGIQWLQGVIIIVDPSCRNTISNFKKYAWTTDKNDNVLNKPIDKDNDFIDAIRYANEQHMIEDQLSEDDIPEGEEMESALADW